MKKKTIRWTAKDRFTLNLSFVLGLSSGILSATLVSSTYNYVLFPTQTNLIIYIVNWIVAGIVMIFFIVKVLKYGKMIK